MSLLSLVIFLPLVGGALVALTPKQNLTAIRYLSLLTTVATFAASLVLFARFDGASAAFQFIEEAQWAPAWGLAYRVGIDGLSIWMVLLTTFISIIAVWFSFYVKERAKEFMVWLLVLEMAMIGVFCALDLLLFYMFFEATLFPMYFLIAIWGGKDRVYSSIKFILFTFFGSVFMLVGIVVLWNLAKTELGYGTFNLFDLQRLSSIGRLAVGGAQMWLFAAFALAFAVKVPMFPVHTWLPDAHTEAPTAGSIVLAAVMLKMGVYGFLRLCLPLFPEASLQAAPFLMGLAVVGIIYGAIMAAVQTDWKRLVAYSSVSHLGFIMLGVFSMTHNGFTGAVLQSINHGISTGALFLMVGMIYERTHTRLFADYGGIKKQMPVFAALFLIVMLSSVGLPSLNGFIGEFLTMLGAFEAGVAGSVPMWMPVLAGGGVVLAAVYLLWMFQKVFYGPVTNPENLRLRDIKPWETACCGLLVILIFWFGLYPKTLTQPIEASLHNTRLLVTAPIGERPIWANPDEAALASR
jgi:NADH-quinone oxidoreductase subunit M